MIDQILNSLGLDVPYEKLTAAERETLNSMVSAYKQSTLDLPKLKDYLTELKHGVEEELAKPNLDKNQDIFLKARLRNLLLLESFFMGQGRAEKAIRSALSNIKGK